MTIPEFGPFEWPLSFSNKKGKPPKYKKATTGDLCCEMRSVKNGNQVKFIGSKSFADSGTIKTSTYLDHQYFNDLTSPTPLFYNGAVPHRSTTPPLFLQGGHGPYDASGKQYVPNHPDDPLINFATYYGAMVMASFDGDNWFDVDLPINDPNDPNFHLANGSQVQSLTFNPNSNLTTMIVSVSTGVLSYISQTGRRWALGVDTVKFPLNRITLENPNGSQVEVKRQPYGVTASIDDGPFQVVDRRVGLYTAGIVSVFINGRDVFLGSGSGFADPDQSQLGSVTGNGITSSHNGLHWNNFYSTDFHTPGTDGEGGFVALTICAGVRA